MDKLRMLSIVAALGFAGMACAQTPPEVPPPESSSDPGAMPSPQQREAIRTAEVGELQLMGMEVITPAGEPLGAVVDVVKEPAGTPAYVVISSAGKNAIVPYTTAVAMVHDNAVVIDQARLSAAPTVKKDEWKTASSKGWRAESDRYWNDGKESLRTATPDSPTERR